MKKNGIRNYEIIKLMIHQHDLKIPNINPPNNRVPEYLKQNLIELQGETCMSTIIMRDLNVPVSIIGRTGK